MPNWFVLRDLGELRGPTFGDFFTNISYLTYI